MDAQNADTIHDSLYSGSILVVDDEPTGVQLLISILEYHGHRIRPATSGSQALAAALAEPPDLILLDVMMPEMSGYDVCRRLKEGKTTRNIPVIFLSAIGDVFDKVHAFSIGAVDYIAKPFKTEEVLARVNTHLKLYRLQTQLEEQVELRTAQLSAEIVQRQQAEERYRTVVEDQTELICRTDPQGNLTFVNQAYCRFFGKTRKELLGTNPVQFILPEDHEDTQEALPTFVDDLSVATYENRLVDRHNQICWVHWTDRVIHNNTGELIEIQSVGRDVTKRRQAQQALKESEERYRALYNHTPVMMHAFDDAGVIQSVNDYWFAVMGYTTAEVQGHLCLDFLTDASRQHAVDTVLPTLFATGSVRDVECQMVKKSGEVIDVLMSAVSEQDAYGVTKQFLTFILDITERKRLDAELLAYRNHLEERVEAQTAELSSTLQDVQRLNAKLQQEIAERIEIEQELAESKHRYEMATEASRTGIWEWNLTTDEVYIDPILKANLGYADNEIANTLQSWVELIHVDDRQQMIEAAKARRDETKPELANELRLYHKDGSVHWVFVSGASVYDDDGNPTHLIGTSTDISDRKLAEIALQDANRILSRRIEELSMLNTIAHAVATASDFSTIVTIVMGALTHLFAASSTSICLLNENQTHLTVFTTNTNADEPFTWLDQSNGTVDDFLTHSVALNSDASNPALLENGSAVSGSVGFPIHAVLNEGRSLILSQSDLAQLANASPELVDDLIQLPQISALMLIPLSVRSKTIGLLAVASDQRHYTFSDRDVGLAETVAGQIAGALENARLFGQEQEQRQLADRRAHELAALLDVSRNVSAMLELDLLLNLILDQLEHVVSYSGSAVMGVEEDELVVLAYRGPTPQNEAVGVRYDAEPLMNSQTLLQESEPIIIDDLWIDGPLQRLLTELFGERMSTLLTYCRSWLGLPLTVNNQLIGILCMGHEGPAFYSTAQTTYLQAFASHTAIALENARLYKRAQAAAADEERSRLARELHDAVTQTLFSASIIADVLPNAWKQSPEAGMEGLEEVRKLTRGALAEMRTLLLELRPATLTEKPLGEIVESLSVAFSSRTKVDVDLSLSGSCIMPSDVQIAFYRILQESLNNIQKHAAASSVIINLDCLPNRITLYVCGRFILWPCCDAYWNRKIESCACLVRITCPFAIHTALLT